MAQTYETTKLLAEQLAVVRMCKVSAAILTVYDHVITFPQEVELIWGKKRSIPSILYMFTRYLGDMQLIVTAALAVRSNLTLEICTNFIRYQGLSSTAVFCFMQAIMIIRLLAMYDNPRRLKIGLYLAFVAEIILFLILIIFGTISSQVISHPAPGVAWCTVIDVPRWVLIWWVPIVLFDFVLFAFAFWIGLRHVREMWDLNGKGGGLGRNGGRDTGSRWEVWMKWRRRGRQSLAKGKWRAPDVETTIRPKPMSMVQIMLRDSVLYYLILLSINIVNSLVWLGMDIVSYEVLEVFSVSVVCIMGSRMILNLRHAYYHPDADGASLERENLNLERTVRNAGVAMDNNVNADDQPGS